MTEFEAFPKFRRYEHETVTLTEKIDGSNACIAFLDGDMIVQSRKRVITPGKNTDNAGFAAWAYTNRDELEALLGPGRHYGEWWGTAIQGNPYGIDGKAFSLFDTRRTDVNHLVGDVPVKSVPYLGSVTLDRSAELIQLTVDELRESGSFAADSPYVEGIMIRFHLLGTSLKHPFNNPLPKGNVYDINGNHVLQEAA